MTYTINFTYRGLAIEAKMEEYTPAVLTLSNGDPGYPAEGGGCESYTWEVDDLDEVLLWLELSAEGMDIIVRGFYKTFGRLSSELRKKIDREWGMDIEFEAIEASMDHES